MYRVYFIIFVLLYGLNSAVASDFSQKSFADIHLHYNWDQEELVTPEQAIRILKKNNVSLAVVFSTPTPNALKLASQEGLRVIHFFSPYISVRNRSGWFRSEEVLVRAREGLQNRTYAGIGELHVVSGMGPRRDNKIFQGLLKLAAEFDVPFNIHTEASSHTFLKPICQQHSTVRFLWAHAGGALAPHDAVAIFKDCPNVWIELSARDPWHYGGLVDEKGKLRNEWKNVLLAHPERFMVGTDPVWNAHQRDRWYEADEGWLHYEKFINFHRKWLAELPEEVEKKIRIENALNFFFKIK